MKILITGANGMLAKSVIERFGNQELILAGSKELDITNSQKVKEFVNAYKPDVIINCAAYTAVDKAEKEIELARKVNAEGPKNLAIAAQVQRCKLIHISTDYVFGGNLPVENVYDENYEKAPETVYGVTKLEGEENLKENLKEYYIFRTAWLYGEGNNFVKTMTKIALEKKELPEKERFVTVVADQYGSPTYAVDLAQYIYEALEKEIPYGIYHATNEGFTTWYEFTKQIYQILGIKCEVIPVTTKEFPRPAKRPMNSKLSKEKLKNTGINIPKWQDALKRYLESDKFII